MASDTWRTRMTCRTVVVCLLALGCSGGGGDTDSTSELSEPLCNGADGARLVVMGAVGGEISQEQYVLTRGRSQYLVVDGHCDYWTWSYTLGVESPHLGWGEVRRGHLHDESADAIAERLRYPDWDALAGDHSPGCGGDVGQFSLNDGQQAVRCCGGCPGELASVESAAYDFLEERYQSGQPADGPIAVGAWLADDPQGYENLEFASAPDGLDLAAIAAAVGDVAMPAGVEVSGATVVGWLRSHRQDLNAHIAGRSFIPAQSAAGERYEVYFRDTMPHENPHGGFIYADGSSNPDM